MPGWKQRTLVADFEEVETDYIMGQFDREADGACELRRISFVVSANTGGATTITFYLHGDTSQDAVPNEVGAVPTTTYAKYTEPTTVTISVDATDSELGVAHLDLDEWPYDTFDEYGKLGEIHLKVDAGPADISVKLTTRASV